MRDAFIQGALCLNCDDITHKPADCGIRRKVSLLWDHTSHYLDLCVVFLSVVSMLLFRCVGTVTEPIKVTPALPAAGRDGPVCLLGRWVFVKVLSM